MLLSVAWEIVARPMLLALLHTESLPGNYQDECRNRQRMLSMTRLCDVQEDLSQGVGPGDWRICVGTALRVC